MLSRILIVTVVAAAASFCAPEAQAQFRNNFTGSSDNPVGPTVSPYLNLVTGTGDVGVTNYQALVRPLIDQGNAINRQGGAINRLQQQQAYPSAGGGTGHASFFMNGSHFYPGGIR